MGPYTMSIVTDSSRDSSIPESTSDAGTVSTTVPTVDKGNTEPEPDTPVDRKDTNNPEWEDVSDDHLSECIEGEDEDDSISEGPEDTNWRSLHSDDVQSMLNASDKAAGHYKIQGHSWSSGILKLTILDCICHVEMKLDAEDAKIDFPHQLATYIRTNQLRGGLLGHGISGRITTLSW